MKTTIATISLSSVLACLALLAQESPRPTVGGTLDERFKRLDRNGDGKLTRDEISRLFDQLDKNKDGAVTREVAQAGIAQLRPQAPTQPTTPSPPEPELVRKLEVRYATMDGMEANSQSLDVYAPKDVKDAPVIIFIHGGGWRNGDKSNPGVGSQPAAHFCGLGFVFVSINYRLTPAGKHPANIQDVAKAVAWVHDHIAEHGGDPAQINIMGHSAGAHLAALVAADDRWLKAEEKPLSILKRAVLLDTAAYDIPRYLTDFQEARGTSPMRQLYTNAFGDTEAQWRDASPQAQVAPGKRIPPMLLVFTGSRMAANTLAPAFAEALTKAGAPSRAVDTVTLTHAEIGRKAADQDHPLGRLVLRFLQGADATQLPERLDLQQVPELGTKDRASRGDRKQEPALVSEMRPPSDSKRAADTEGDGSAAAPPETSDNNPAWVTQAVTAPRVQFRTFDSAAAKTKVSYHIYTPAIYDEETERKFPVLYWLHGTSGGLAGIAPVSAFFDRAIREKKIPSLLVVFPNGLVASMWCDSKDGSVPMETVVIKELLPHIDATFHTVAKREARIVEGFSMGGYGSARLGFKHHDLFAGVSILAGGPLDLELQGPKAAANPVGRERILRNVFGGDLAVFKAQSPWVLAEQHAAAVRGRTRVRMATGERDFTYDLNREFSARLKDLTIPHNFTTVPGVGHDTMALLNGLGEGNWEFYRSVFGHAAATQPETDSQIKTAMPPSPVQILPPGDHQGTIRIGGRERNFLLHVPPGTKAGKPMPLVIMLHGGGGTAENAVKETGWSTKANTAGFLVAYPNATPPDPSKPGKFRGNPQTWNDASGRFPKDGGEPDDVAFIGAMIDDIATKTLLDPNRIFVTGFSNGASMAFAVGAGLSGRIAAIAPVAGVCWLTDLKLKRGVSLCYITGTADPLNPIPGGPVKLGLGGRDKPPVRDSVIKWVEAVCAKVDPADDSEANGVRTRRYGPGNDGAEVVFITIEGQGHIWPGGVNLLPELIVGKATDKLKAVDAIWEFFEKHPLKPAAVPLTQPSATP